MSDMPERIWANQMPINTYSLKQHNVQDRKNVRPRVEYIRADLVETLKRENERLREAVDATELWQPIETAPRDGTVFIIQKPSDVMPEFYSAWYAPLEKVYNEGMEEFEGHLWVLNDGQKTLIPDEEDGGWLWSPLPEPPHKAQKGKEQ